MFFSNYHNIYIAIDPVTCFIRQIDKLLYKYFEHTDFSTENLGEMLKIILIRKGITSSENSPKDSTTNGR